MSKADSPELTAKNTSLAVQRLKLIVLSGRSGSGKSSTAFETCHTLRRRKVPHTHIDGDNLDAFYPRNDNPYLMLLNLKSMWSIYYREVQRLWERDHNTKPFVLVLSGTGLVLDLEAIVRVISEVVHDQVNLKVHPIVLEAGDDIVKERLTVREIGGELEEHLQSTNKMSHILRSIESDQIMRFRTDNSSVTDVASEILRVVDVAGS